MKKVWRTRGVCDISVENDYYMYLKGLADICLLKITYTSS